LYTNSYGMAVPLRSFVGMFVFAVFMFKFKFYNTIEYRFFSKASTWAKKVVISYQCMKKTVAGQILVLWCNHDVDFSVSLPSRSKKLAIVFVVFEDFLFHVFVLADSFSNFLHNYLENGIRAWELGGHATLSPSRKELGLTQNFKNCQQTQIANYYFFECTFFCVTCVSSFVFSCRILEIPTDGKK